MNLIKASFLSLVFAAVACAQLQFPVTESGNNPSPNAPGGNCFTQTIPVYNYVTSVYWYCVPNTSPPTNLGTWTSYTPPTSVLAGNSTGQAVAATAAQVNALATAAAGVAAGSVTSAGLAANTIQFVSVPLTLSALQTLNSIPVQVVAAQGAGTFVEIQSCTLNLKRGSAAFTGGGTVTIGYGASSATVAGAATIAATVFTTFAASQSITVAGALAVNANTGILNVPVWINAASGDFASGTGATGVLDCAYRVHTGF